MPKLQLGCSIEHSYEVGDVTYSSKTDALTAPPMSIGPVGRKLPMGRRFSYEDPLPPAPPLFEPPPPSGSAPYRGIFVSAQTTVLRPKPFYSGPLGPGFRGRANLATVNDTRGALGTEACDAGGELWDPYQDKPGFEWAAVKQVKRKNR